MKLCKAVDAGLPQKLTAAPSQKNACLAMLQAKQEAMDRGVPLPVAEGEICERCRSVFATLDLSRDACRALRSGTLPDEVKRALEAALDGLS